MAKNLLSAAIHRTSLFMVIVETSLSASLCHSENLDHVHCLLNYRHNYQNSTATVTMSLYALIVNSVF